MREVAQIRGRLQKLVLNEDLPEDADMMVEALRQFVSMCHDYEDETERDFEDEVYKKRRRYMDIEMLKLSLSDKRRARENVADKKLRKIKNSSSVGN